MSKKTHERQKRRRQMSVTPQGFQLYWCPTEKRAMVCPGPCPDGTEHELEKPK